jgi:hypothetical protein
MVRHIMSVAAAALVFTGIGGQPAVAQTAQECGIYAQQACLTPAWQQQGYSSVAACRNAYFNHCYYGDPLEPLAYKPDANKTNTLHARRPVPTT